MGKTVAPVLRGGLQRTRRTLLLGDHQHRAAHESGEREDGEPIGMGQRDRGRGGDRRRAGPCVAPGRRRRRAGVLGAHRDAARRAGGAGGELDHREPIACRARSGAAWPMARDSESPPPTIGQARRTRGRRSRRARRGSPPVLDRGAVGSRRRARRGRARRRASNAGKEGGTVGRRQRRLRPGAAGGRRAATPRRDTARTNRRGRSSRSRPGDVASAIGLARDASAQERPRRCRPRSTTEDARTRPNDDIRRHSCAL